METPMVDMNMDPAPWPTWLINWMSHDQTEEPDSSAGNPDSVTGQARMGLPNTDTTPRSALRLVTKTCGLFNSDLTGVDLGSEISPVPDVVIGEKCIESLDFIGLFDEHSSLVNDQSNVGNLKDSVDLIGGDKLLESLGSCIDDDLLSLPDSPFGAETNFLEVFSDLSAQIAQEYVTEQEKMSVDTSDATLSSPTPPSSASIKSTSKPARGRATLKRKAKEPPAETVSSPNSSHERLSEFETIETEVITGDVIPNEGVNRMSVALANVNNDHDYTLKAKRPCLASDEVTSTKSALPKPSTKEEKYIERRMKNNIASRRSRKTRKDKFFDMEERATTLVQENVALEEKITKMEALAKAMKEALIQRMATK